MQLANVDFLSIKYTDFVNNSAFYDEVGGVRISSSSFSAIENCKFEFNIGFFSDCGGAIRLQYVDSFLMSNIVFTDNSAMGENSKGGAVCMIECSGVLISNATFTGNEATVLGGAIYLYQAHPVNIHSSTFIGNKAIRSSGSAVFVMQSEDTFAMSGNYFAANEALLGAGTVFWKGMSEPLGLRGNNTFAQDNIAGYGPFWATDPFYLRPNVETLNVTNYGSSLPAIVLDVLDFYEQVVTTDDFAVAQSFVRAEFECGGNVAHLGGGKRQGSLLKESPTSHD